MTKPYYKDDAVTIYHGDALAIMREMPDSSVDLIATDPPYYRVKNEAWDRQWDTRTGFLSWVGELCEQWQRILKPNGSLYCFASPQMRAHVEVEVGKWFNCLPTVTWRKNDGNGNGQHSKHCKERLRAFAPQTEAIIFAEHYGADNMAKGEAGYVAKCDELRGFVFEPLRAYFGSERIRCGISNQEIMDGMAARGVGRYMFARHTFSRSQWQLPTREQYEAARDLFNSFAKHHGPRDYLRREYDYLRREYDDLRSEYEDLRREYEDLRREYEDLRRPFSVTADVPYTDVWDFQTVGAYKGKHPCEKPIEMMEHIVRASSRPGAVVLDCFAGSGTTAHAATKLGRKAVLIELEERYCEMAAKRMAQAVMPFAIEPDTKRLTLRDGLTDDDAEPLFSAADTQTGETEK